MSEILLEAIRNLEERIQELENRKPLRGEKGPPGSIDAALRNLEEAAPALVDAGLRKLKITTLKGERGEPGRDGRDGQDGQSIRGENAIAPTRETVESLIAVALSESQLLDETGENAGPLLKYAIQKELERLAVEHK